MMEDKPEEEHGSMEKHLKEEKVIEIVTDVERRIRQIYSKRNKWGCQNKERCGRATVMQQISSCTENNLR